VALAAYQGFAGFDGARSFTAWALGIAHHKAIDWMRRNGPHKLAITDERALEALAEAALSMDRELGDRESALHGCVEVLAGRSQELVRLHYAEAMPLEETGTRLGLTLANTKVLLYRLRLALRDCVERRLARELR
jgi:RNA polymerase sigma-70 factor (ECF subfamily)